MENKVKEKKRELSRLIKIWNTDRLPLYSITEPTDDDDKLEYFGIVRIYFFEGRDQVETKCFRISSNTSTIKVIQHMLNKLRAEKVPGSFHDSCYYSLFELHENGEVNCLDSNSKPLRRHLLWADDGREGKFVLICSLAKSFDMSDSTSVSTTAGINELHKDSASSKRNASTGMNVNINLSDKSSICTANASIYSHFNNPNGPFVIPDGAFHKSIKNRQNIMNRQCQKRIMNKIMQLNYYSDKQSQQRKSHATCNSSDIPYRLRNSCQNFAQINNSTKIGTLKIFATSIFADAPYKTVLISIFDDTRTVIKEALYKFKLSGFEIDPESCYLTLIVIPLNGEATDNSRVAQPVELKNGNDGKNRKMSFKRASGRFLRRSIKVNGVESHPSQNKLEYIMPDDIKPLEIYNNYMEKCKSIYFHLRQKSEQDLTVKKTNQTGFGLLTNDEIEASVDTPTNTIMVDRSSGIVKREIPNHKRNHSSDSNVIHMITRDDDYSSDSKNSPNKLSRSYQPNKTKYEYGNGVNDYDVQMCRDNDDESTRQIFLNSPDCYACIRLLPDQCSEISADDLLKIKQIYYLKNDIIFIGSDKSHLRNRKHLGQTPTQILRLSDSSIHNFHCVIACLNDGVITIASSCIEAEVQVNGSKIVEPAIIQNDCLIRIGLVYMFSLKLNRNSNSPSPLYWTSQSSSLNGKNPNFDPSDDAKNKQSNNLKKNVKKEVEISKPKLSSTTNQSLLTAHLTGSFKAKDWSILADYSHCKLPIQHKFNFDKFDRVIFCTISKANPKTCEFKLEPAYTLYMTCVEIIDYHYKHYLTSCKSEKNGRLSKKTEHSVSCDNGQSDWMNLCIQQFQQILDEIIVTLSNNSENLMFLSFWLANLTEFSHLVRFDKVLAQFSDHLYTKILSIVAELIRNLLWILSKEMDYLLGCIHQREQTVNIENVEDLVGIYVDIDENSSINIGSTLKIAKRQPTLQDIFLSLNTWLNMMCQFRMNTAFTVQIFQNIFLYINDWLCFAVTNYKTQADDKDSNNCSSDRLYSPSYLRKVTKNDMNNTDILPIDTSYHSNIVSSTHSGSVINNLTSCSTRSPAIAVTSTNAKNILEKLKLLRIWAESQGLDEAFDDKCKTIRSILEFIVTPKTNYQSFIKSTNYVADILTFDQVIGILRNYNKLSEGFTSEQEWIDRLVREAKKSKEVKSKFAQINLIQTPDNMIDILFHFPEEDYASEVNPDITLYIQKFLKILIYEGISKVIVNRNVSWESRFDKSTKPNILINSGSENMINIDARSENGLKNSDRENNSKDDHEKTKNDNDNKINNRIKNGNEKNKSLLKSSSEKMNNLIKQNKFGKSKTPSIISHDKNTNRVIGLVEIESNSECSANTTATCSSEVSDSEEVKITKRLKKLNITANSMKKKIVTVRKPPSQTLGINIVAAKNAKTGYMGVYIKEIMPGSPIDLNGQFDVGDQLLSVNDEPLTGVSHEVAVTRMKGAGSKLKLEILKFSAQIQNILPLIVSNQKLTEPSGNTTSLENY